MRVKVMYSILAVLFFGTMSVYAQDQPPSASDMVAKMQSKLNLTPDQITATTPIIEKYASKHQELRQSMEDGNIDRDAMHSQMKQLKEDEKQELSQVLSADQLSQWEAMQSQGRHKHSSEGDGGGSGGDNSPVQQ